MNGEPTPPHATQFRNHWWWRPGWSPDRRFYTWHLTFEGQHQLHQLVSTYQDALANVPCLDLIPLEWLHLTMQGVGFTDEVTPDDAHAIAEAATNRLATHPPAALTFYRPVMRPEAIALLPEPAEALETIRNTIRAGIADIWGDDGVPESGNQFEPHLSLAYINTDGPANSTQEALTRVTPTPVRITVTEASLIILQRGHRLYHWRTFARASLGESANR